MEIKQVFVLLDAMLCILNIVDIFYLVLGSTVCLDVFLFLEVLEGLKRFQLTLSCSPLLLKILINERINREKSLHTVSKITWSIPPWNAAAAKKVSKYFSFLRKWIEVIKLKLFGSVWSDLFCKAYIAVRLPIKKKKSIKIYFESKRCIQHFFPHFCLKWPTYLYTDLVRK